MTLHLYFARRFLMAFLGTFGVFGLMLGLFDLLEQVRRFDNFDVPAFLRRKGGDGASE